MTANALDTSMWGAVRLTPINAADADRLNAWQNDPEIRDLTMGFRGPVPWQATARWIDSFVA